nr:MAG TPA: hypothetical protein [Caudoviricetes sp.]
MVLLSALRAQAVSGGCGNDDPQSALYVQALQSKNQYQYLSHEPRATSRTEGKTLSLSGSFCFR